MSDQTTAAPGPSEETADEYRHHALNASVRAALEAYFDRMGNHEPRDLYELVLAEVEQPMIQTVMERCRGNQTLAARVLGLSRGTLRKKLARYGIE